MNTIRLWEHQYEHYPYGYSKCLFCRNHQEYIDKNYIKDKDTYKCKYYTNGIPKNILKSSSYPDIDEKTLIKNYSTHSLCKNYVEYKIEDNSKNNDINIPKWIK